MSLSVALTTARSSLQATGVQSSVISRNIAGVNEASFSRKNAVLATYPGSGVYVASIQRAADAGLFTNLLTATSASAEQNVLYNAIQKLSAATVDDPEKDQSPAAVLAKLTESLQQFATIPDDVTLAQAFVSAAVDMAQSLNDATADVQELRQSADADMAASVENVNALLEKFEAVNTTIIKGTIGGDDITDYLDMRDNILSELSQEIGITTVVRGDNDMVIYTDSGATLFERTARSVSFMPTYTYDASITGNDVYVDGVPVTGASAVMPIHAGNLAGLATVRDEIAVTYQGQLDEIARTLVEIFAESDQSAIPTLPDVPGLFDWPGAPAMPATGVINVGLAGTIGVNAAVDPDQGGDPTLIRDGAINGNPAYLYNATGAAGFSDRLDELTNKLASDWAYDPAAAATPSGKLIEFAGSSVSWLEAQRASADADATYQQALVERTAEALSNVKGVNTDDQMVLMLQIERTFTASAKVISTIDTMLKELLAAVG